MKRASDESTILFTNQVADKLFLKAIMTLYAPDDLRRYAVIGLRTILWCSAVGLLFQNVELVRQNRGLRAAAAGSIVTKGQQLDDLSAISLDGTYAQIKLPSKSTERLLLLTMSPNCPACRANQRSLAALSDQLRRTDRWKVAWMSRDPVLITRKYCERTNIPLTEVFAEPAQRTYVRLGLQSVPSVIVIGPGGVVEKVWTGRLKPEQLKEMAEYCGASYQAVVQASSAVFAGVYLELNLKTMKGNKLCCNQL
jgi:peroxiredoxin